MGSTYMTSKIPFLHTTMHIVESFRILRNQQLTIKWIENKMMGLELIRILFQSIQISIVWISTCKIKKLEYYSNYNDDNNGSGNNFVKKCGGMVFWQKCWDDGNGVVMVAAVVTGYQVMASCGNDCGSRNNSYGNMKSNS